ncbi:MAG: STAS domain-containing protein [Chitinispirillaceae bacterium]|nr:STAS domain-containing protein [Chitinispirillaceae bacterium]
MAHDQLSDKNRLVFENRLGYLWVLMPESITVQDYTAIEDEIVRKLSGKADRVVIDFSHVRALYSSGLGILIRLQKKVNQGGGVMALVNVAKKIVDLLTSLHLDKILPMYHTDVEFEISHDELWKQKLSERKVDFLFIAQVEKNIYRITLSGEMISSHDMSACRQFLPDPKVQIFIFDISSLSAMDSNGAGVFMNMLDRIVKKQGTCRTFGANRAVKQVLQFLGAEQYLAFYNSEQEALAGLFA